MGKGVGSRLRICEEQHSLAQPPCDNCASALVDTINLLLLAPLTKVLLNHFIYRLSSNLSNLVPSIPIQTTNHNLIDSHIFITGFYVL